MSNHFFLHTHPQQKFSEMDCHKYRAGEGGPGGAYSIPPALSKIIRHLVNDSLSHFGTFDVPGENSN